MRFDYRGQTIEAESVPFNDGQGYVIASPTSEESDDVILRGKNELVVRARALNNEDSNAYPSNTPLLLKPIEGEGVTCVVPMMVGGDFPDPTFETEWDKEFYGPRPPDGTRINLIGPKAGGGHCLSHEELCNNGT